MGLNPRKRGRGRGSSCNGGQWGSGTRQEPVFTYGLDGAFCTGTSLGEPQGFGQPSGFNVNQAIPRLGKFLRGNASRRHATKSNVLQSRVPFREKTSNFKNFYCESCDKSFRTEDDLLVHKAGHETCNHEGCAFTAHPKIIAKHIKMQHESGLYSRIGNLYTEEDIAKWLEERKKRYPTRKVIEDKKLLEEEKLKRGERIKDDECKFNKLFSNRNRKIGKKNFGKQTHRTMKNRRARRKKETPLSQKYLEENVEDSRKGVPAFSGIGNVKEPELPEKNELNISDDEWDIECKAPNITKALVNNSLGLLATFYNSDEDNVIREPQNGFVVDSISADEGSGPEEVKTVSSKNPLPKERSNENINSLKRNSSEKKEMNKRKRENTFNHCTADARSLSLLEKLLKKEIRHERNVILQCIHYIVNHNFFET